MMIQDKSTSQANSRWAEAMTLSERAAMLNGHLAPGHNRDALPWNEALAQRRANKWMQQRPFNQERWLHLRLARARLNPKVF